MAFILLKVWEDYFPVGEVCGKSHPKPAGALGMRNGMNLEIPLKETI